MKRQLFFVFGIMAVIIFTTIAALVSMGRAQYDTPQTIRQFCISNTTLSTEVNETRCIDSDCDIYSKNAQTLCEFGCDSKTQICSPNPFVGALLFLGFIFVIIVVFALAIRRLNK